MKFTPEEVMQFVAEDDVKFIRLAFCDIYGRPKNISLLPTELKRAFEDGIAIDGSAVAGFGGDVYSDLFLHPDASTLSVLPWRPEHGKVVRMFCSVTYPDGRLFENDTRSILKKAVEYAQSKGFSFSFGTEMEFYLFKLDEDGSQIKVPYDNAGYMDIAPEDKGENVRREICLQLEKLGIRPEASHHEEGPAQNEIDFRYSDPVSTADNAITFATVVKTVAAKSGLWADFSPKPLSDKPGNGMHINMSVKSADGKDYMNHIIAGVLARVPEMTVFLNPVENSYNRLGKNKAPRFISWAEGNRSQLIRVPAATGDFRRMELRSPDPATNPYLAFALLIYAAMDGIIKDMPLPEPVNENMLGRDSAKRQGMNTLPASLSEAQNVAFGSEFIREILPERLINSYCR